MNHDPHVEADLPAYVDGRLDEAARAHVAAHLESCVLCARSANALRAVERLLDDDRTAVPLAPMWPAIARHGDRRRRRIADLGFALATAASLAAGFTLGVLAVRDGAPPESAGTDAPVAVANDTDPLETSVTTLSDVYFSGGNGTEQAP